jgi:hypothetical protein
MFYRMIAYYPKRRKLNKASEEGQLYQVFVEKDATVVPSRYINVFEALHTLYHQRKSSEWFTIEFNANTSGIRTYCWLSGGIDRQSIQSAINTVHPYAEIVPVQEVTANKKDDYVDLNRLQKKMTMCATLTLGNHYLFNLALSGGDRPLEADIISALCTAMQGIRDHEDIGVQFLIRPVDTERTRKVAYALYNEYKETGKYPSKWSNYPLSKFGPYLEFYKEAILAFKRAAQGSSGKKDFTAPKAKGEIEEKITADCFYDVMIRLYVSDTKAANAKKRLDSLISTFAPSTAKNYLRVFSKYSIPKWDWMKHFQVANRNQFLKDYKLRRVHTFPIGSYLSPAELTTLCHFPNKNVPNIVRLKAKKLPVPDGIYQYNSIEDAWRDKAIVFGMSNYRGTRKYLAFKDITMLMQHCYVIGGTGSGKSYWLSFIALQVAVIAKVGLTFFDVKGDVADELLQYLPKSEWDRVVYIDLQDMYKFMPINILKQHSGESIYNIATMIVDSFIQVFGEKSIQAHSQNVLRNAVIAVASTDKNGTLLEVYRMFTDDGYLLQTIERMKQMVHYEYPDVLTYWETYAKMNYGARKTEASSIINKLAMITQNERPRYTFSQPENVLNWRQMMDERKIVLVNFAMDKNPELILNFFGTIFTRFIRQATFSRGDIERNKRVPHLFIMDEFQKFLSRPDDIVTMLELSRSYRVGVVMAHQSLAQVKNDKLLKLITDNTFSQISLAVGDGSGAPMAKILSTTTTPVTGDDLESQENFHGYARFKLLSPEPFTFKSLNMTEYFEGVNPQEVKKWKEQFKEKYYQDINSLRSDINARYARAQAYLAKLQEEEEKAKKEKQNPAEAQEKVVAMKNRRGAGVVQKLGKGVFD